MSNNGFIKIPRKLFEDPDWISLNKKQKLLYILILELSSWKEEKISHKGILFTTLPGQILISISQLVYAYNERVESSSEKVNRRIIQRALSRLSSFNFLSIKTAKNSKKSYQKTNQPVQKAVQKAVHPFSLITITNLDVCDKIKTLFAPALAPESAPEQHKGFIKVEKSLFQCKKWKKLNAKQKLLLILIIELSEWKTNKISYKGNDLTILPGELLISFGKLAEIYNLRSKSEKIDKYFVMRSISRFSDFGLAVQKAVHPVTLITITYRDVCNKIKTLFAPASAPLLSGVMYKKNEKKIEEEKEKYTKEKVEALPLLEDSANLLESFFQSLFSFYPEFPKTKARKTKTQKESEERLLKRFSGRKEPIIEVIRFAHRDPFWISHVHSMSYLEKKFDTLLSQMKKNGSKRVLDHKFEYPKYIKPGRGISFADYKREKKEESR